MSTGTPEQFLKRIGSSVIAITGGFFLVDKNGEDGGDMLTFACSAFAMSFGGVPVLVTAGHVIDDILDPIIVKGEYKGGSFVSSKSTSSTASARTRR